MSWYAIHVRTGREDAMCDRIRKQAAIMGYNIGFELLVPKRKLKERHQGECVEVIRTMFPGYVLVQSDEIRELAILTKHCEGLFRYLENEGEPQEIKLEEILAIACMTDEFGVIGTSKMQIESGIAQVVSGPLKGNERLIVKLDKHKQRAKVSFLLNGKTYLIDLGVTIIGHNPCC